ncbi:ABC-2 transporter permease [Paenibacillus sp. DYY-L-2]|uniref:ABC-2 transporter permease n=1 Tax=Paenibacillus sp. DYY-L-2 TaxID=3447013 RepID=UPI003F505776
MPNIMRLLRKDLILVQRYLWLLAIYAFVFSGFIQSNQPFLLYSLLPGMLMILAIGNDLRTPNQQFMVSLPVGRNFLVFAKYVSSLMFLILSLVICAVINTTAHALKSGEMMVDTQIILGTFVSMTLFVSLYLPLYYWLASKGAQFLNIAMMIVIMVGNGTVSEVLSEPFLADKIANHPGLVLIFAAGVTVLALIVSYLTSLSIFRKRDL